MSLFESDADNPTGQHASATSGAHAFIGACLTVLVTWFGITPFAAAWGVGLGYFVLKEVLFDIRLDTRPRVVLDSILDAMMIGLGCALVASLNPEPDGYDAALAGGGLMILALIVALDKWRK